MASVAGEGEHPRRAAHRGPDRRHVPRDGVPEHERAVRAEDRRDARRAEHDAADAGRGSRQAGDRASRPRAPQRRRAPPVHDQVAAVRGELDGAARREAADRARAAPDREEPRALAGDPAVHEDAGRVAIDRDALIDEVRSRRDAGVGEIGSAPRRRAEDRDGTPAGRTPDPCVRPQRAQDRDGAPPVRPPDPHGPGRVHHEHPLARRGDAEAHDPAAGVERANDPQARDGPQPHRARSCRRADERAVAMSATRRSPRAVPAGRTAIRRPLRASHTATAPRVSTVASRRPSPLNDACWTRPAVRRRAARPPAPAATSQSVVTRGATTTARRPSRANAAERASRVPGSDRFAATTPALRRSAARASGVSAVCQASTASSDARS